MIPNRLLLTKLSSNVLFYLKLCCCFGLSVWAWNTTMDKPIHEREHNDCQQLITKSHGRSCLDSNIQPQEISNAYLSVKGRVTVNVTCQCSEKSNFWHVIDQAPCWVFVFNLHVYSAAYNLIVCPLCRN